MGNVVAVIGFDVGHLKAVGLEKKMVGKHLWDVIGKGSGAVDFIIGFEEYAQGQAGSGHSQVGGRGRVDACASVGVLHDVPGKGQGQVGGEGGADFPFVVYVAFSPLSTRRPMVEFYDLRDSDRDAASYGAVID